jgi:hypothetical protein
MATLICLSLFFPQSSSVTHPGNRKSCLLINVFSFRSLRIFQYHAFRPNKYQIVGVSENGIYPPNGFSMAVTSFFKHHVLIQWISWGFPMVSRRFQAAGVLPDAEILLGSDFPEDASEVRRFAASLHEVS